jgi:hypothetical protein
MHVNVIGILAGSLSPREPARRLGFLTVFIIINTFCILNQNYSKNILKLSNKYILAINIVDMIV